MKKWKAPASGYGVFVNETFNAIVPLEDIKPHEIDSLTCPCDPTTSISDDSALHAIHNSFEEQAALESSMESILGNLSTPTPENKGE